MGQFTTAQETALTEAYLQHDLDPSKQPDFALVIAGWPTIYTCSSTPTIPSSGGDITTAEGFTTVRQWMQPPKGYTSGLKGDRPEAGEHEVGVMEVDLLDINAEGTRELSGLLSRHYHLENTGAETTLASAINASTTTVVVAKGDNIADGDVIYVSEEAMLVTAGGGTATLTVTRGYRQTSAVPHDASVNVYLFMPASFRRKAWIYKGYVDLPLASWIKGYGGVIVGEKKGPGAVSFDIRASTWETYGGVRKKHLVRMDEVGKTVGFVGGLYGGDYNARINLETSLSGAAAASLIGNGHWMLKANEHWYGIVSAEYLGTEAIDGSRLLGVAIVKGFKGLDSDLEYQDEKSIGNLAWTNCDFTVFDSDSAITTFPLVGSDPIELMLQLLLSRDGDQLNHATYDVFSKGTGLGIPADMVDIDSFTVIQGEPDYDDFARCFFVFKERVEAKKFIEEELCRPFGWYLYTRNDGRIALKRPKNPVKLHTSQMNRALMVTVGGQSFRSDVNTGYLSSGVRTASEMAAAAQAALNGLGCGVTFAVSYNTGTNKFSVTGTGASWTLNTQTGANEAWETLGFTTDRAAASGVAEVADSTTAVFTATDFNTLTANEIQGLQEIDNREASVAQVIYRANYSWDEEDYKLIKIYEDAESRNIYGSAGAIEYEIKSKGLLILRTRGGMPKDVRMPWTVDRHPTTSTGRRTCAPETVPVSTSYGLDADNSWASLFSAMLFDRYKTPPLMVQCKLPWRFNTKEPGDVLKVTCAIDGVVADRELNATTLTSRLFEIVSINPAWRDGQCEVVLLGHRDDEQ